MQSWGGSRKWLTEMVSTAFQWSHFFFEFFCILKSVSGQLFGCLIPYDVGNVVILNNVLFLM